MAATIIEFLPTSDAAVAGGCSFAEHPDRVASEARLIWSADVDGGVLRADVVASSERSADIDFGALRGWRMVSAMSADIDHIALSDGCRHLRLDVARGALPSGPVALRFRVDGLDNLAPPFLALRRLERIGKAADLPRHLDRPEPQIKRWLEALRVADALREDASYREIGIALFGPERIAGGWRVPSDALQSRVRRLVALARVMTDGGYWHLLDARSSGSVRALESQARGLGVPVQGNVQAARSRNS